MKGGFYPAPSEAIAHAATFLRPPREPFTVLDPCAGQGAAIQQLGELLSCPGEMTFAIELDESRAEKVRAELPNANVLAFPIRSTKDFVCEGFCGLVLSGCGMLKS